MIEKIKVEILTLTIQNNQQSKPMILNSCFIFILISIWEAFEKPIKAIFDKYGFGPYSDYAPLFALIVSGILIYTYKYLTKYRKFQIQSRKKVKAESDLFPTFDESEIEDYTKFYIRPRFQLKSPTIDQYWDDDSKKHNNITVNESTLISVIQLDNSTYDLNNFILNHILKEGKGLRNYINIILNKFNLALISSSSLSNLSRNRYIAILADTGMGKTAFQLNFILNYLQIKNRKYNIEIRLLSSENVENSISEIPNKKNTILLLDALDEDPKAIDNVSKRKEELEQLTYEFRKVIISCRTQFFNDEKNEPKLTGIPKHGAIGRQEYSRLYLSPFSNSEVKHYFSLKYKKGTESYNKAISLFENIPDVSIRPMILKYFDNFMSNERNIKYKFDIYELIVENWIEREKYKVKQDNMSVFKAGLYQFSNEIAVYIYNNSRKGDLTIKHHEIDPFAKKNNINLNSIDLQAKSLLHRGKDSEFKFAHKSILEFFLSKEIYCNEQFKLYFEIKRFDAAYNFYKEQCEKYHTIPFIKSKLLLGIDSNITEQQRIEIINNCVLNYDMHARTIEVIIWRENSSKPYSFDWSLISEITEIGMDTNSIIDYENVIIGIKNLKKITFHNSHVKDFNFLKYTKINEVILINYRLQDHFEINNLIINNVIDQAVEFKFV